MKWTQTKALALGIFAALLMVATVSLATEQEQEGAPPEGMTPEMQAEMEAWAKLAQPGEHHKHLEPYAGKWKSDIKMWMAPDAEPMTYESMSEARWVMDGRYLEWTHSADFQGMPWEGRQIDAYNNGDQRYETVWIDNFGTLVLLFKGECEDEGKTRVLETDFTDAMTGGQIHFRAVYSWIDDDQFKYEAYMTKDGQDESKSMEMVYTRQ